MLILLVVLLLVPAQLSVVAAAKGPEKVSGRIAEKGQVKPKKTPVRMEVFQPDPANEVAVDRLEVNWFEDGTAEVVVQGQFSLEHAGISYDLVVDPKRKTFSTKSKAPHKASGRGDQVSILATSYHRFVMITTHDPADVPLAETREQFHMVRG